MKLTLDSALPVARYGARPFMFIWNSWRALSARDLRYVLSLGLVLASLQGLGNALMGSPQAWWRNFLSEFQDTLIPAFVLVLCLAVAAQVKTTRLPKWIPYIVAAIVAVVLILMVTLFEACDCEAGMTPLWLGIWLQYPSMVLLCCLAALGYMYARDARQRADVLRNVQLERAKLSRGTYESKLQAMQARVEPQFLFDTLGDIERLYETDASLAERMLDDLIAFLRAALPSLRESSSTLAMELALSRAWLNIMQIRRGGRLSFAIAIAESAQDARMPPMVLLPLIHHAIQSDIVCSRTDSSLAVEAVVADGRLRVTLADAGPAFAVEIDSDLATRIRRRLHTLYGAHASVAFRNSESGGTQAIVEIPYEGA
jgi:hypothetical protein